jgi:hypothetical protein
MAHPQKTIAMLLPCDNLWLHVNEPSSWPILKHIIILIGIILNILRDIYLDRMDLFQHDMISHMPNK